MRELLKLKRLWLLVFAPAALILNLAAANNPGFAEWYAVTIYPTLSRSVNAVTSLFPFSLAEFLIFLFFFSIVLYLILYVIRIIRKKGSRAKNGLKCFIHLICAASVVYFAFTITCGINYNRYSFAQTSGLEIKPSSKSELIGLCSELADDINSLRNKVETDDKSVMKLSDPNIKATAEQAQLAYQKISADYPLLHAGYGEPKPVLCSRLMSYCNITGIFVPFTFEANVNVDVPDYSIPSTMCHELSHLRGFMREDEANFIGYLVCKKSDSAEFQYSGKMLAFIYTSNVLYDTDSDAANSIFAKLSDGVRRDLAANSAYWKQFEGPVAKASNSVNNSYLKANHQEDGVKSYGRMVDLLLAEYRTEKEAG